MSLRIQCPECGETEDLKGSPSAKGIRIRCGQCGKSWLRDSEPQKCVTCGGVDLVPRPRALTQYSRGTQLSIVGIGEVLLCRSCDARMLKWSEAGRAVPFNYRSSALDPEAAADRAAEGGDDVLITP